MNGIVEIKGKGGIRDDSWVLGELQCYLLR